MLASPSRAVIVLKSVRYFGIHCQIARLPNARSNRRPLKLPGCSGSCHVERQVRRLHDFYCRPNMENVAATGTQPIGNVARSPAIIEVTSD